MQTAIELIRMLRGILTRQDKKNMILIVCFTSFLSLVEVVGITAIMPFLATAINFELIHTNKYYFAVYSFLGFDDEANFVIAFGFALIGFYVFRMVINLLYTHFSAKFGNSLNHRLTNKLFRTYFQSSYLMFTRKNTSTLNKTLMTESGNVQSVINSHLSILSGSLMLFMLYALMLYANVKITIALTIFIAVNSFIVINVITKRLRKEGILREAAQKIIYEIANRGFGNFKLLKLRQKSVNIEKGFYDAGQNMVDLNVRRATLSAVPRMLFEIVGFSAIISIVTYLVWVYKDDVADVLPVVTIFVLALYRFVPAVTNIINAVNSIAFLHPSIEIIYEDLQISTENLGDEPIDFNRDIVLDNVTFEYNHNLEIFNNACLTIKKGQKIAFVGESGGGKTTLVDLIIGLYEPKGGEIMIDGTPLSRENRKQWREKIGYIPQDVYLFDGTVAANVILGHPYDKARIDDVLKKANIYDFLQTKDGLDTLVGERGVILSGGQKQRIAIARALYDNPEILALDEATSSLDNETEFNIMEEIYKICKDKTLIIIAHRLSTTKKCDIIYKIDHGVISKTDHRPNNDAA